jgi:hypothetical protein
METQIEVGGIYKVRGNVDGEALYRVLAVSGRFVKYRNADNLDEEATTMLELDFRGLFERVKQ